LSFRQRRHNKYNFIYAPEPTHCRLAASRVLAAGVPQLELYFCF